MQISVSTTATRIDALAANDILVDGSLTVYNPGPTTVYFGNQAAVTTSTGTALISGASYSCDLRSGAQLFGIVASGTQTVHAHRAAK